LDCDTEESEHSTRAYIDSGSASSESLSR
jgi:hypothetical protein